MKRSIKLLLAGCSLTITGATISPLLTACVTAKVSNFEYNANNNQLNINNSKLVFPDSNNNIFVAYNNLLTTYNDSKTTNDFVENLNSIYSQWLTSLELQCASIKFDLSKLTIDGFSFVIPTTINGLQQLNSNETSNNNLDVVSRLTSTKINFNSLSIDQINQSLNQNTISVAASQAFPSYTLQDIQKLPSQTILDQVALSDSIIFDAGNNFPIPVSSIIKHNDDTVLRILVFIPNKGLGQILITQYSLNTVPVQLTTAITTTFGENPVNSWNEIINKYMDPIEKQDLTEIAVSTDTVISYDSAKNSPIILNKLDNYTIESQFAENVETDLTFFLKNYLSDVQKSWNTPGLLSNSVFTTNNLVINSASKTVSGSIGIIISNSSTSTKKLQLPVNNKELLVNANSSVSILIKLNNSNVSPYLTIQSAATATAYLTTAFSNVELIVYQTPLVTSTINNALKIDIDSTEMVNETFTVPTNIFPYSYVMKTVVNNVESGNSINNSKAFLDLSLSKVSINDLKSLSLDNINNKYQDTLIIVKSAQNILLKVADNTSLYDLLSSIDNDLYDIFYLLTNNKPMASVLSDIFSTKKASEFLYANIDNIISIIKQFINQYPQLSTVLDMLQTIANTNQTLDQMKEWVESIESLYPTLEKLLGSNVKWIMPLLKTVMTSISQNDPTIMALLFDNIEPIFSFLTSDDAKNNIDVNTLKIFNVIHSYLESLITFSKQQVGATSFDNKYKNIKTLDVLAYELTTTGNRNSTLLNCIATVLQVVQPNSPIISTLKQINSMIGSVVVVPNTLKDYSGAIFNNEIKTIGAKHSIKSYRVETSTIKTVSLVSNLGSIIKSLMYAYVGDKKMDLYSILANNVETKIQTNTFTYNSASNTVNQNLDVKMNFKQTVTFDLLPLSILLDNVTINLTGLLPTQASQLQVSNLDTNDEANNLTTVTPNVLSLQNITVYDSIVIKEISATLGAMLPIDLVIKPENYLQLSYRANSAKLTPVIDSTGKINWAYNAVENVAINYDDENHGVLQSSNSRYNYSTSKESLVNHSYYGSKYKANSINISDDLLNLVIKLLPENVRDTVKKAVKNSKGYFGVDTTIALKGKSVPPLTIGLTPLLASFNGGITNYVTTTTNLANPSIIPDYNENIFVDGATVIQKKTNFEQYLQTLINNYGQWTVGSSSNKPEFSLKSGNDLDAKIKEYFSFGSAFSTNKYVSYKYGISASQYNLLLEDTYSYKLEIIFNVPVLYKESDVSPGSMLSKLTFNVTSNTLPKSSTTTK